MNTFNQRLANAAAGAALGGSLGASIGGSVVSAVCACSGSVVGPAGTFFGAVVGGSVGPAVGGAVGSAIGAVGGFCGSAGADSAGGRFGANLRIFGLEQLRKKAIRTTKMMFFARYLVFIRTVRYTDKQKQCNLNNFSQNITERICEGLLLQHIPARGRKRNKTLDEPFGLVTTHPRQGAETQSCAVVQPPRSLQHIPARGRKLFRVALRDLEIWLQHIPARGRKPHSR